MRVHQVLSGAGPFDAVTLQALAFRELFDGWGWDGEDAAPFVDPRIAARFGALRDLDPGPDDVVLVHYSAHAPGLSRVLELPGRRVLLSHNVTPARWFWDHEPQVALQCELGRRQLPEFAAHCHIVAGVSAFNAAELGSDRVVPILLDPARLGAPGPGPPPGPPMVLFVGRLAPHKRQDEVIRAFALLRRHRLPEARLVLVGEPLHEAYRAALAGLAEQLVPGAVTIESSLSPAQLAERFRAAHAFLCLSEHEGFCVPLLEAFHFGVPVVARPRGAVAETAGDAALLLDGSVDAMAELTHLAITDSELAGELRARGRARLAAYAPEESARALRALLEEASSTSA